MLKDKKIIHKTDGKNIHSHYRKKLLNKLLVDSALSFQSLTLYAILAAVLSSVKQLKQTISSARVLIYISTFVPSMALQAKTAGRLQEECSLPAETSCAVDKHRFQTLN